VAPHLFEWRDELRQAPELIAADRLVAHEIGFYMNADGTDAWPGTELIVAGTALKKSTVLSSLAWLLETGWLDRSRRSKRERYRYVATIPTERKTRTDRAEWASDRKHRLTTIRSESVGIGTHSAGRNGVPTESVGMGSRVGRNGYPESVGMGTHGPPTTSQRTPPQTSSTENPQYEAIESGDEKSWNDATYRAVHGRLYDVDEYGAESFTPLLETPARKSTFADIVAEEAA
jgi:hypothetical protein